MKKSLPLLFIALLALSCGPSKDDTPAKGGAGKLEITGYSPLHPYLDDEFTITGTGFDPNKLNDTVYFSHKPATITSATATELKLTFPPDLKDNLLAICYCTDFEIRANGKSYTVQDLVLKRTCSVNSIDVVDDFTSAHLPGRPGDSLDILGSGFTTSGMTISIDGKSVTHFTVDSSYWSHAYFRLPKDFFGEDLDESVTKNFPVTVTNRDGRTGTQNLAFYTSPTMTVSTVSTSQKQYSVSELQANGGVVNVTVTGKNLKPDTKVTITMPGAVKKESLLDVHGFPETATIPISPSDVGTYSVRLHRATSNIPDANYGSCSFKITN